MSKWVLVSVVAFVAACAPAHLRPVGVSGEREIPELFLGGWDGKRLRVFDDTTVEPGVTTRPELVASLKALSSDRYAVVYVEKGRVDAAEAAKHELFCDAPLCIAILERKGGSELAQWGRTLAIFELGGPGDGVIGPVWLAANAIRPPGPRRWELFCRGRKDEPRFVHPDGGALYPARGRPADGFALFGPAETPNDYRRNGYAAPSEKLCDEELVRLQEEPEPERPEIRADPSLLGGEAK